MQITRVVLLICFSHICGVLFDFPQYMKKQYMIVHWNSICSGHLKNRILRAGSNTLVPRMMLMETVIESDR